MAGLMIPQFQEVSERLSEASICLTFCKRMVSDTPPMPCEALSRLLLEFSRLHPQVFFKPLFICAASTKEVVIAHQLTTLISISSYLPGFWTSDAEMIAVALMSDVGGVVKSKGKNKVSSPHEWGKHVLGQCVVLLEVIGALRAARLQQQKDVGLVSHSKFDEDSANNEQGFDESYAKVVRFASVLEARLSVWLHARVCLST